MVVIDSTWSLGGHQETSRLRTVQGIAKNRCFATRRSRADQRRQSPLPRNHSRRGHQHAMAGDGDIHTPFCTKRRAPRRIEGVSEHGIPFDRSRNWRHEPGTLSQYYVGRTFEAGNTPVGQARHLPEKEIMSLSLISNCDLQCADKFVSCSQALRDAVSSPLRFARGYQTADRRPASQNHTPHPRGNR